jgi:hypothetical protein
MSKTSAQPQIARASHIRQFALEVSEGLAR